VAIKDQPHDPPILDPGEIQLSPLITLRFFTNSLSQSENPSALTKGVFINPAPEGKITTLFLLRSRAPSITVGESEEFANLSFRGVYKAGLTNGETCYLMAIDTEGEFTGFKTPPSHGQRGWISPPADLPRYEYTGRITLLPNSEAQGYEVLECAGQYFDEPEFSKECAKFISNG